MVKVKARFKKSWESLCPQCSGSDQPYMDFLQSGNKQMCDLRHLAEREACDWAGALVQSQSFTVTISGDVTFGQNHTAICEACQQTTSIRNWEEKSLC